MLTLLQGCLLPQDESVFPVLPQKQNSPMRIVAVQPEVRLNYLVRTEATRGSNCTPTFTVTVEDQDLTDLTDTISSRWYIDRPGGSIAPIAGSSVVYGGGSQRAVPAPVSVSNQLSTINDAKEHLVEVFVTDSDFTDEVGKATRAPLGLLPDGGTLDDTVYVDTRLWLVTVQPCP
jgi:hypothetical protein